MVFSRLKMQNETKRRNKLVISKSELMNYIAWMFIKLPIRYTSYVNNVNIVKLKTVLW